MVLVRLVSDLLLSALDLFCRIQRHRMGRAAPAWIACGRSADSVPDSPKFSLSAVRLRCASCLAGLGSRRELGDYIGCLTQDPAYLQSGDASLYPPRC